MRTTIIGYLKIYLGIVVFLLASCSKNTEPNETPLDSTEATVSIAKWKDNKVAVISLLFDDSTPGQATLGVSALNSRNMVGTWFVNPGRAEFNMYISNWENAAATGQELANHTMTHTGASTYAETVYEVGDASKIIWGLRNEEEFGSLISFSRGGGTAWNEDYLAQALNDFKNIDRLANAGTQILAITVSAGAGANQMSENLSVVMRDNVVGRLNFHGIAAENGDPPMDYGVAGVWINEFESFLDSLAAIENEIWIGGCIAVYKYIKERETAEISIVQYNTQRFSISLSSEMDEKYYNEPLTILTYLPVDWANCRITHNGSEKTYAVNNGLLMFDAAPNKGEISITKN